MISTIYIVVNINKY
jgi:hypothetical protein